MHTGSFRTKDYNNRRVFLRSYPLHWGDEVENDESEYFWPGEKQHKNQKYNIKPMKKLMVAEIEWSERARLWF